MTLERNEQGGLWDEGNARAPQIKDTESFHDSGRSASPPSGSPASPRHASASPCSEPILPPVPAPRFYEWPDMRLRPGLPEGWPHHKWTPELDQSAPKEVIEGIAKEMRTLPVVAPGGLVVFTSARAVPLALPFEELGISSLEDLAGLSGIHREGEVFKLCRLGTFSWFCLGLDAVTSAYRAGRVEKDAWKEALFAWGRLKVALQEASAFPGDALDWAEAHARARVVREFRFQ